MLGKLPVPGRPTNLDYSRARACCACNRCGWGLFGHFSLICLFSPLSPSLWETARYRLKYCLKGPLNPKQPTNLSVYSFKINLLQKKALFHKRGSVMYKTIYVINIIIYMCSQHSNVL